MISIPSAAYDAAMRMQFCDDEIPWHKRIINAAAPLIIAADLRILLARFIEVRRDMFDEDDGSLHAASLDRGIWLLEDRITELDPRGITSSGQV